MKLDYEVGIVGAGFSGIIAALELKKSKRERFVLFEKAEAVGGVWRDNVYPGCACDIRSTLYCIEKEPNPNWSASFPSQPEIFNYLNHVVQKNDLRKHLSVNTEIKQMEFDEVGKYWRVTDQNDTTLNIKVMILATGPHRLATFPNIEGIDSFQGKYFHSAHWDSNIDLKNKKVAVIGTGASSIQIVPAIADKVGELTVFQRSGAWIVPRWNRKFTRLEKWLFKQFPAAQRLNREANYWFLELIGTSFFGNEFLHKILTRIALHKLKQEVKHPETRQKLTPNYKMGCKRILVSDTYLRAFNRDNVHIVTDSISTIQTNGIATENGNFHEMDVIIYATGFKVADLVDYINIKGEAGKNLNEQWDLEGAAAFKGINVAGYPNLCLMLGPNSGLSHSSAVHVMESQMKYILQYLKALDKKGELGTLDVKADLQKTYNQNLQEKLKGTIWQTGCSSWYLNKNGKNTVIFPGLTHAYRKVTKRLNLGDYEGSD